MAECSFVSVVMTAAPGLLMNEGVRGSPGSAAGAGGAGEGVSSRVEVESITLDPGLVRKDATTRSLGKPKLLWLRRQQRSMTTMRQDLHI